MRLVGRVLGYLFILGAIGALALDLVALYETGALRLAPLGEVWYRLDRASLNMLQAGIERNVAPFLWHDVIAPVLQWPAALVLVVPGIVLLIFCGGSARGRFD